MTTADLVRVLAQGVLVYGLIALIYVGLAWSLGQRGSPSVLGVLWVLAAVGLGVFGLLRMHDSRNFAFFLVLGLVSFGFATLSVRKRLRGNVHRMYALPSAMLVGLGWFFVGLVAVVVPAMLLHIEPLFGR